MACRSSCFAGQQNSLLWGGKQEVAEEIRIDLIGVRPKMNGTLAQADRLSVLNDCYISSWCFPRKNQVIVTGNSTARPFMVGLF